MLSKIENNDTKRITYTRNGAWISEKRLVLKRRGNAYDIVITFNDRGAIIAYIYKGAVDNYSLTIKRGKDNLASEINGFVNNDAVSFGFSYSFGMVEVVRENAMGIKNTFKLVMY